MKLVSILVEPSVCSSDGWCGWPPAPRTSSRVQVVREAQHQESGPTFPHGDQGRKDAGDHRRLFHMLLVPILHHVPGQGFLQGLYQRDGLHGRFWGCNLQHQIAVALVLFFSQFSCTSFFMLFFCSNICTFDCAFLCCTTNYIIKIFPQRSFEHEFVKIFHIE